MFSQYIIEVYIRKTTYVTLSEYNLKMKMIDRRFIKENHFQFQEVV